MRCQRENSVLQGTLEPRSMEELEGSFLDPNAVTIGIAKKWPATRTSGSSTLVKEIDGDYKLHLQSSVLTIPSNIVDHPTLLDRVVSEESAALPSSYFQYKEEEHKEDKDGSFDQDLARIKNSLTIQELNDDTPAAALISTSEKARVGSEIGRLAAAKERELTISADRQAKAKPYHEKVRIEAAQKIARQRSREGFSTMKQDDHPYINPMILLDNVSNRNDKCFIKKGSWTYDVPDHQVHKNLATSGDRKIS
jgi:hypothetical protein